MFSDQYGNLDYPEGHETGLKPLTIYTIKVFDKYCKSSEPSTKCDTRQKQQYTMSVTEGQGTAEP